MKLRDLKEWLDSKDDSELDEEIIVSDRMWATDERDIYQIVKIGYQMTDGFKGYVLLTLSQQFIDALNKNDKIVKVIDDKIDEIESDLRRSVKAGMPTGSMYGEIDLLEELKEELKK